MDKDQATKLRMLAKKKGVGRDDDVLTFSTFMNGKYPERRASTFWPRAGVCILLAVLTAGIIFFVIRDKRMNERVLNLAHEKQSLSEQLDDQMERSKRLQDSVVRSSTYNEELMLQLKKLDFSNDDLKEKLKNLEDEKTRLTMRLSQDSAQIQSLADSNVTLQEQLTREMRTLQGQIDTVNKKQESLSVGVRNNPSADSAESEGAIIYLNNEFKFAVVNLGRNSGIIQGASLEVVRGAVVLGTMTITEVRPEVSACDARGIIEQIAVGDRVRAR